MVSLLFGGLATFGEVITFGGSLFSGLIRSHKVLTLLSGGGYFRRVITIGTLRYSLKNELQYKFELGMNSPLQKIVRKQYITRKLNGVMTSKSIINVICKWLYQYLSTRSEWWIEWKELEAELH